jgi:MIP family channel proteins
MSTIIALFKHPTVDDTSNRKRLVRDTLVEGLATTVFVYFGTLSAVSTGLKLVGSGQLEDVARVLPIAMAFGVSIMALVYAIGHVSGGHMNPGVSLLMMLKRQMSWKKMLCYWAAQFLGAIVASSLVWGSSSSLAGEEKYAGEDYERPPFALGATTLNPLISSGNGFLLELMGSFFFYFVISQTALDKTGIAHTHFPAIPIGFTLVVVHICLIPFTGCGVNPARTFGPSMVVCMSSSSDYSCSAVVGPWYWIYWIGPFMASWLVAEVTALMEWNVQEDEDAIGTKKTEDMAMLDAPDEVVNGFLADKVVEKMEQAPKDVEC